MQLIFNWCENFYQSENDVWSEGEEEMIALEISQREWGFATAKVTLASVGGNTKALATRNPENDKACEMAKGSESASSKSCGFDSGTDNANFGVFFPKKFAKIGQKLDDGRVETIFIGRVLNFPIKVGNTTMDLEFIAEPPDYQKQLAKFVDEHGWKNTPHIEVGGNENSAPIDSLFYSEQERKNPTVLLEGKNEIFYWNMKTGQLEISHIFRGKNNCEISGNEILEQSLKIHLAREPYSTINVRLSAEWIQRKNGLMDLFPIIAQRFNYGIVNSYSDLTQPLREFGKNANAKNYEIVYRDIKEINPNTMGCLTNYPIYSEDLSVSGSDKKINFKRFYYDGNIILSWCQKYKISESINIKIVNAQQKNGRGKNLYLKLNNIQSPKEYPNWRPYLYYKGGARVIFQGYIWQCRESHQAKVDFDESLWKRLNKISTALADDTVASFFTTDNGKQAIKYAMKKALALMNYSSRYVEVEFCIDANKYTQLSVADTVCLKDLKNFPLELRGKVVKTKFFADYKNRLLKVTIACGKDLSENFEQLENLSPNLEIKSPEFDVREIVKNIEVKNLPEEQIAKLKNFIPQKASGYKKILKNTTTAVAISLQNYREKREIIRDMDLGEFRIRI